MKVIERRIVKQEWYETDTTKTGWDNHGWTFDNGEQIGDDWTIVNHIHLDKFGNPFVGVAEREVDVQ
jgi:hypothetical protein